MIRDKSTYKIRIHRLFPLFFWIECWACHKELRRELMWRVRIAHRHGWDPGSWYNVCRNCLPHKRDVREWVDHLGHLGISERMAQKFGDDLHRAFGKQPPPLEETA